MCVIADVPSMFAAYLSVTLLTAGANIFSAMCDFVRYKQVSIAMARAGVPDSWMTTLGILKAAQQTGRKSLILPSSETERDGSILVPKGRVDV
jgi:hypothetical protein